MSTHEDFEKWRKMNESYGGAAHPLEAWQAALSFRQPEIDALKAENEKLRKDAERLEYLMDCIQGIHIEPGATGTGIYTWALQIREPIPVMTEGELMHSEIRAAIDAAMTPDTKER